MAKNLHPRCAVEVEWYRTQCDARCPWCGEHMVKGMDHLAYTTEDFLTLDQAADRIHTCITCSRLFKTYIVYKQFPSRNAPYRGCDGVVKIRTKKIKRA